MRITDEMLLDALNEYRRTDHEQCGIKRGFVESTSLSDWAAENVEKMRAAITAALSRAAAPEPEWEYNTQAENGFLYSETTQEDAQLSAEMSRRVHDYPGSTTTRLIRHVVRRRKAGPWEPVPEEGNVR